MYLTSSNAKVSAVTVIVLMFAACLAMVAYTIITQTPSSGRSISIAFAIAMIIAASLLIYEMCTFWRKRRLFNKMHHRLMAMLEEHGSPILLQKQGGSYVLIDGPSDYSRAEVAMIDRDEEVLLSFDISDYGIVYRYRPTGHMSFNRLESIRHVMQLLEETTPERAR